MMKVKFHIVNEEGVKKVKTIKKLEENINYVFPPDFQNQHEHVSLFNNSIIKNSTNSLKKEKGFRNIVITLDATLEPLYLDSEGNFVFKQIYLDEEVFPMTDTPPKETLIQTPQETSNLLSIIENLQKELNERARFKKHEAEKQFNLEKFNGKGDAAGWLDKFCSECDRFGLTNNDKVEVMRVFLTNSAVEWYLSNVKKGIHDWNILVQSFNSVFGIKNWAYVRYAVQYKYINGSLVDYLLTKQRLLLDMEKEMTNVSLINLMVIGLPLYIQNKLKKTDILTTDHLFQEVANLDIVHITSRPRFKQQLNKTDDVNLNHNKQDIFSTRKVMKTPCSICKQLNYPNRFHPEIFCRNKDRIKTEKSVNISDKDIDENDIYQIMNVKEDEA